MIVGSRPTAPSLASSYDSEHARFTFRMATPWRLAPDGYHLRGDGLSAVLPLRGPTPGLRRLAVARGSRPARWPGPILAVQSVQAADRPAFPVGFAATRPEHRLRTNLIDLDLAATERCPLRVHLYWSAAATNQIDFEALVTTLHEFERLEVQTRSESVAKSLSASAELFVRAAGAPGRWLDVCAALRAGFDHLVLARDRNAAHLSLDGRPPGLDRTMLAGRFAAPLICYRPAGQSWSYVEMSHPDDCVRVIIVRRRDAVAWSFSLFGLDIEKGVILRGRVRGAVVARQGDLRRAEWLYRQFTAEPPHLSV